MAEDHGALEAGQLSRVGTSGRTQTESRQRASGAKRHFEYSFGTVRNKALFLVYFSIESCFFED